MAKRSRLPWSAAVLAAVLFAIVSAGCIRSQEGPSGPGETTPPESGQPPAEIPDSRFLEPIRPEGLLATNCTGWMARQFWPGPESPEPRISSWNANTPGSVFMQGFHCKRIAFDGLERGPVDMVLDYADNLDVPEECGNVERTTGFFGLYSWGLSDPDLVNRLADVLAAPTYLMDYVRQNQTGPDGTLEQVDWGPPGSERSTLHIDAGQSMQPATLTPSRFYWPNATGVIALDISYESKATILGDRFAYGMLAPPMQLAAAYPVFASSARWFDHESVTGTIHSWSDIQCTQPSGPSPPS